MMKYIFQPRLNLFDVVLIPFVAPLFWVVARNTNILIAFGASILMVAIVAAASTALQRHYCKRGKK